MGILKNLLTDERARLERTQDPAEPTNFLVAVATFCLALIEGPVRARRFKGGALGQARKGLEADLRRCGGGVAAHPRIIPPAR